MDRMTEPRDPMAVPTGHAAEKPLEQYLAEMTAGLTVQMAKLLQERDRLLLQLQAQEQEIRRLVDTLGRTGRPASVHDRS